MKVEGLANESQQKHLEKVIDHIYESISLYTGEAFFHQLVQSVSRLLHIDYMAIGEFIEPEKNDLKEVHTISVSYRGTQTDNFHYVLNGTPCENVSDGNMCSYEQGVQQMFPEDIMLQKKGIDAYAGFPLADSKGKTIGLLLALHRKPFEQTVELKAILNILSVRASLELERIKYERKMKKLAYIDELTNLPNRNQFMESLKQSLNQAKEQEYMFALLTIDLDRFKKINELEGYEAGDILLKQVTERLILLIPSTYFLSRIGGDKFSILIPRLDQKYQVNIVAENILQEFKKPFILNDNEYYLKASIGICIYPYDGDHARLLIQNADQAVYQAKKHLGNTYEYYSPLQDIHMTKYAQLEKKLHKALERNELYLYYQPQVDAQNHSIIGWEVLLRWTNGEEGLISPEVFIPIIENIGLIIPIGYWVIEEACLKVKEWEHLYQPEVCMMINLSAYQLLHHDFAHKVHEIMTRTGVKAHQLGFEITENISLHNIESSLSVLRELKGMGLKLALDDFGMGYSSLSYLKHFPIDVVKIDRSFVKDISTDCYSLAICRSIIDVCHSLGLKVLAEGVENESQTIMLKDLGCDAFQGFLFSRPIPSNEVEKYVIKMS